MNTIHKFKTKDTRHKQLKNESIDLVVTSPPYPMIKMWDDIFISMNSKIDLNSPNKAFHLMNLELKKVYKQMYKALKIGGLMIINIGDATRTIHKNFKLYTNAAKTISMCIGNKSQLKSLIKLMLSQRKLKIVKAKNGKSQLQTSDLVMAILLMMT